MKLSRLSPAELETMLALWENREPVRPVVLLEQVNRTHAWNISTLQTILTRLEEKEMVRITSEKRLRYCTPKITKEEYAAMETRGLIERLSDCSPVSLMAGLINTGRVTESELDEIDALLRAARKKCACAATPPSDGETACPDGNNKGETV